MLILDNEPFQKVDQDGFINLMAHAAPNYPLPGRKYFTNLLDVDYESKRGILQHEIDKAESISFTSDIWSDMTSKNTFISLSGNLLYKRCS